MTQITKFMSHQCYGGGGGGGLLNKFLTQRGQGLNPYPFTVNVTLSYIYLP